MRQDTHRLRSMLDGKLIEERGFGLIPFLDELRNKGISWMDCVIQVKDITGISVSHESLRNWYKEAQNNKG